MKEGEERKGVKASLGTLGLWREVGGLLEEQGPANEDRGQERQLK